MRKILLFIAACALPFALLAGENAAKTEENIFELPISKMPPDYFKYEVAFFKDMQINCNFAFLLGGKLEENEDARGIYYEFTKILPGISPIRIITPKGVSAEIRMYERVKKIEAKKKGKNK